MFGGFCRKYPRMIRIVAVAEPADGLREAERERNGVPPEQAYRGFEEALAPSAPPYDVAMVATNDRTHYGAALAALRHGCHVLLEKPVAHRPELTAHLAAEAKKRGLEIAVQHELRYTPFFQKVKQIVDSGVLGRIYSYTHTEHVEFCHMTHGFVRGQWRNDGEETPMILAKCCHDLDLIPWILGDEVARVSSFGRLDHFTPRNKPPGAPPRCTDGCPAQATCIHDAEAFYLPNDKWLNLSGPDNSPEARRRRLAEGPWSLCVYGGMNNVVDHQTVLMETAKGCLATLTMQGFSIHEECGRKIRLDGSTGTLRGDMKRGEIMVYRHWHGPCGTEAKPEICDLKVTGQDGHGGGDEILFKHVIECFWRKDGRPLTSIAESVESHLLAWAAEASRLEGRVVNMDAFRRDIVGKAELVGRA
jgi:predicted dehydrogenase